MSLLDKASLIMTPNAVKESNLYSIVPSNGNGDMTVVRGTTATRVNEQGFIEEVPYNLVKYSSDFNNSIWQIFGVSSTKTLNAAMSPDGLNDAVLLSGSTTDAFFVNIYNQNLRLTDTRSIWAKTVSGTGTISLLAHNSNLNSRFTITNEWQKFTLTGYNSTGANQIYAADFRGGNLTQILVWAPQAVEGSAEKPYFPTTDRLNVPRLNYDIADGCPSILLEPQRTNLVLYSEQFGDVSWNKSGLIIQSGVLSPKNDLTATNIIASNTNLSHSVYKNVIVTLGTVYNYSIFVKPNGYNYFILGSNTSDNVPTFVVFDLINKTGKVFLNANNYIINYKITELQGFYKCELSLNIGNGGNGVRFSASISDSYNPIYNGSQLLPYIFTGDGVSGINIWGAQVEQGSYATSYIPTVASTVTRNADLISRNNIYTNRLITSAGGTWFVELNNNFILTRDASSGGIYLSDNVQGGGGTANTFGFNFAGATGRLLIYKRVSNSYSSLYTTLTDTIKVAIKWNGTTADVFVNGVKVVYATDFTTTIMEFLNGSGGDVPKYIKSTMLFPAPLTDTECIQLTTL